MCGYNQQSRGKKGGKMPKIIDWNMKVMELGCSSVKRYLMTRLPKLGQKGVAQEIGVSEEAVRNKMGEVGVKKVIKTLYESCGMYKRYRTQREIRDISEHVQEIDACIPEAEAKANEEDIDFSQAMNIITIGKGIRKSKEWILKHKGR